MSSAGRQPAFEEAQQQAAAAGGHYASEAQATPRVDVGDPLRRQASISASTFFMFATQLQILKGVCWRGRVLFWHVEVWTRVPFRRGLGYCSGMWG